LKTIIMLCATFLMVGCTHSGKPETSAGAQTQAAEQAASLEAALSGRIAGPPQVCVNARDLASNTTYVGGAILFRDRTNDVIWLNRPTTGGCSFLNPGRTLKFEGPQLCRENVVTVVDPATGRDVAACGLGEFTPYRLAR
jgi:hypothetical protein